ncbi:MAG: NAD(P)-dependent oxidoreductase [Nitrososphaerota archaeon]
MTSVNVNDFVKFFREKYGELEGGIEIASIIEELISYAGLKISDDLSRLDIRATERILRKIVEKCDNKNELNLRIKLVKSMLEFIGSPAATKLTNRVKINKLDPEVRRKSFQPFVIGYTVEEAIKEAARCFACKEATCIAGCPLRLSIPAFMQAVANNKFDVAKRIIMSTSPFVGVCGYACFHPCESNCLHSLIGGEGLAISHVKRAIYEYAPKFVPAPKPATGFKIAVIGAGPAGLTAAYHLRLEGHEVTVFDESSVIGGMMMLGIPKFRLPRNVVNDEINILKEMGVMFVNGKKLGVDFSISELFNQGFHAIFISIGAMQSQFAGIPGEDLVGVVPALSFLKRVSLGFSVEVPATVSVIGGGDVAIDAARTAIRLGANDVKILYRRSEAEMPAMKEHVAEALEEGVKILYLTAPKRFIGINRKLTSIECIKMELGPPDSSGRRRPIPVPGSEYIIESEMAIIAIGQSPNTEFLKKEGIELRDDGRIKVNEKMETSIIGVFAGGDAVRGPATLVEAIADGKNAAIYINNYLKELSKKD